MQPAQARCGVSAKKIFGAPFLPAGPQFAGTAGTGRLENSVARILPPLTKDLISYQYAPAGISLHMLPLQDLVGASIVNLASGIGEQVGFRSFDARFVRSVHFFRTGQHFFQFGISSGLTAFCQNLAGSIGQNMKVGIICRFASLDPAVEARVR